MLVYITTAQIVGAATLDMFAAHHAVLHQRIGYDHVCLKSFALACRFALHSLEKNVMMYFLTRARVLLS